MTWAREVCFKFLSLTNDGNQTVFGMIAMPINRVNILTFSVRLKMLSKRKILYFPFVHLTFLYLHYFQGPPVLTGLRITVDGN